LAAKNRSKRLFAGNYSVHVDIDRSGDFGGDITAAKGKGILDVGKNHY